MQMEQKQEAIRIKVKREQEEQAIKKAIEDKILVKDASVKLIQKKKWEEIEEKKVIMSAKRIEKKAFIENDKEFFIRMQ